MGRWTQYDEDEYRLPEGMKRIGYDSDSERYYFRDTDGSLWVGPQGSEFGQMTRVNTLPASIEDELARSGRRSNHTEDLEASPRPTRIGGHRLMSESEAEDSTTQPMVHQAPALSAYRSLFPFFLIIAVLLLLVWRLLVQPSLSSPVMTPKRCPEGTTSHWIQPGQSCWELSHERGWSLAQFKEANPKVNCEPLLPGTTVCIPPNAKLGTISAGKERNTRSIKPRT